MASLIDLDKLSTVHLILIIDKCTEERLGKCSVVCGKLYNVLDIVIAKRRIYS